MKWKFPIAVACIIVAIEISLALILSVSAPSGMRWLGDTIQNASDVAVYQSYLRQGADGHVLLKDLYAIEPHPARFDPVWSSLAFIAQSGVDPVVLHECARWVFTFGLVFAVYFASRSITRDDRDAHLATFLAFAGVGCGWLYSIWLAATHAWTLSTYAAADIVTEFSIAPVLLGGAHMILSFALLVTGLRLMWRAAEKNSTRDAWLAAFAIGALASFHPYFVPLIAIFAAITIYAHRRLGARRLTTLSLPFIIASIPTLAIYVPLAFDPVFRTHHLVTNRLPLAPAASWIATLLPFTIAFVWRYRRHIRLKPEEQWIVAWIASAVICMILPIPWTRKYTEGLGFALILLTLPAWIELWKRFGKMRFALWLAAALGPLHLFASQLAWAGSPATQSWFYRPIALFDTWSYLHSSTPTSAIVLSDDMWVNVWTPAYAVRRVLVAHDHETPDFAAKRDTWKRLMTTNDPIVARDILNSAGVTAFITTSATSEHFTSLLGSSWHLAYRCDTIFVYATSPTAPALPASCALDRQ